MLDLDQLQAGIIATMENLSNKFDKSAAEQDRKMTAFTTQLGGTQANMEESIRGLLATKTSSQREAINQQFLAQNLRVSMMEKCLNDMFVKLQTFQTSDKPLLGMLDYENVPDISSEDMMEAASL